MYPFKEPHDEEEIIVEFLVDKEQTVMIVADNEVVIERHSDDVSKEVADLKVKCEECGEIMHKKSFNRHKLRQHLSSKLKCQYCNVNINEIGGSCRPNASKHRWNY